MPTAKKQKGFTLIELLVVTSIIALLAAIALVGLAITQKRARDAHRIDEIKTVQFALEQYYLQNNQYPTTGGFSFIVSLSPNWQTYVGTPLAEYFPGGAPMPPGGAFDPYNYAYINSELSSVCLGPNANGKYYYLPQSTQRQGYILWVNKESVSELFLLAGGNVQIRNVVGCSS